MFGTLEVAPVSEQQVQIREVARWNGIGDAWPRRVSNVPLRTVLGWFPMGTGRRLDALDCDGLVTRWLEREKVLSGRVQAPVLPCPIWPLVFGEILRFRRWTRQDQMRIDLKKVPHGAASENCQQPRGLVLHLFGLPTAEALRLNLDPPRK